MKRAVSILFFLFAAACWPGGQATSQSPQAANADLFKGKVRPFVLRYCMTCHHQGLKTADIALDQIRDASQVTGDAELWEKVFRKIRTGEMPPPGAPRPKQEDRELVAAWIEKELDRAAAAKPDPGQVAIHRLNRAEYNNAVRDLFAVDFRPADDFPADDAGYGFDNNADVLSLPPVLLEKYLRAADRVTRMAVGNQKLDPVLDRITVERSIPQSQRVGEEFPAWSRGGALVTRRFPADAEYLLRVRLRGDMAKGLAPMMDLRLDGVLLKRVEARISEEEADEDTRRFEVRVPVRAGNRQILATFLESPAAEEDTQVARDPQGKVRRKMLAVDWLEVGGPFNVTGPGDTESRRRIFVCLPKMKAEESACAQRIVGRMARLAYRRQVTLKDTQPLMRIYSLGRRGGTFDDGVQLALKAMLVSPNFLFRVEQPPAPKRDQAAPSRDRQGAVMEPVSDVDLASRLSFFLWSSIPDEELLGLAEKRQLSNPAVLKAQASRMLKDPKARALTDNFAGQWLHLRNLSMMKPDPEKFPDFDPGLRQAMQKETELFFETVVKEDRNVLDFLDGPFTFVNERLARHYGIPGVKGMRFQRVSLDGVPRSGVLTQGSILTVSSYPTRTSPVIRGKWILENFLGAPPPPPPPNVPELQEKGIGTSASLRQQLEQHRANPACAGCHSRMDPLGFALENFDATGKFRTHDGNFQIDAAGVLPSGAQFKDAEELKKVLRGNSQDFVQCLSEKLLTYALGRGLERYDKPIVRGISRTVAQRGYRFSAMVEAIVDSLPFRMRRAEVSGQGVARAAD